jgi:hypothetical protein
LSYGGINKSKTSQKKREERRSVFQSKTTSTH